MFILIIMHSSRKVHKIQNNALKFYDFTNKCHYVCIIKTFTKFWRKYSSMSAINAYFCNLHTYIILHISKFNAIFVFKNVWISNKYFYSLVRSYRERIPIYQVWQAFFFLMLSRFFFVKTWLDCSKMPTFFYVCLRYFFILLIF